MKTIHNNIARTMASIMLAVAMVVSVGISAYAADYPLVNDEADLLTKSEVKELQELAEEYSDEWGQDIVIYTTDSLDGEDIDTAAEDYFIYNGFGQGRDCSGIILLLDMGERSYYMATTGDTIDAITDYGIDVIGDAFVDDLSDGDYAGAFETYLEEVNRFLRQADEGEPYDVDNTATQMPMAQRLGIAALIGLGAAILFFVIFASQLRTAVRQHSASDYVSGSGFNLTNSRDLYLYSNTHRRRKPEQNKSGGSSTHIGSSGRSHGGGGGRF